MAGRFALHWRSDGPAHLLDLAHLEHHHLDSCRPRMFESMITGPLSCLKGDGSVALYRSTYSTRITTRPGISCFLPPPPKPHEVIGSDGDWLSHIGPFGLAPVQVPASFVGCTLPLLVKLSNLTPSPHIAWSTEVEYSDMQATSPGATAKVATSLVDGTPGMCALLATLPLVMLEHQLDRPCIDVQSEAYEEFSLSTRENIYYHHRGQDAVPCPFPQFAPQREVWARLVQFWYYLIQLYNIKAASDRHTRHSRSGADEDTTASLGKLGQGLIRDG